MQKDHPKKVLQIRYEDLVTSPKKTLIEICDFLGISYQEGMDRNVDSFDKRIPEHHKSLQKNLTSENLGLWKTELTKKQQLVCESLAGEYGKQFGYELFHEKKHFGIDINGFLLGYSYVPFLKIFQKLPIFWKNWMGQSLIRPNFAFWKNSEKTLKME